MWKTYCRWEISVWAAEADWYFPFMFVSQWWLVSWLLHFTRFAWSHLSSLSGSLWVTPSLQHGTASHSSVSANLPWLCSVPLSHRSGKLHITYRHLFSTNGLVWIWAWSSCVNSLYFFPQEEFLQVQSTTDAYPGRNTCAPALGGVFGWIHRPILLCLCFHCLCWDCSSGFFRAMMVVCVDMSTYYRKTHYANIDLEVVLGNPYLKLLHFSLVLSASLFLLSDHFMNETYRFH